MSGNCDAVDTGSGMPYNHQQLPHLSRLEILQGSYSWQWHTFWSTVYSESWGSFSLDDLLDCPTRSDSWPWGLPCYITSAGVTVPETWMNVHKDVPLTYISAKRACPLEHLWVCTQTAPSTFMSVHADSAFNIFDCAERWCLEHLWQCA